MHRHDPEEKKEVLGPMLAGGTRPLEGDPSDPLVAGHETAEIRTSPIVRFLVGLGAAALLVFILMGVLFNVMEERAVKAEPRLSPLVTRERERVPPEPRLQVTPLRDYQVFRAAQDSLLRTYGWANRETGTVRIPIERAMEILAARRLGASRSGVAPLTPAPNSGAADPGGAAIDGRTGVDSAATPAGRLPRGDLRLRPPSHAVEPVPSIPGDSTTPGATGHGGGR